MKFSEFLTKDNIDTINKMADSFELGDVKLIFDESKLVFDEKSKPISLKLLVSVNPGVIGEASYGNLLEVKLIQLFDIEVEVSVKTTLGDEIEVYRINEKSIDINESLSNIKGHAKKCYGYDFDDLILKKHELKQNGVIMRRSLLLADVVIKRIRKIRNSIESYEDKVNEKMIFISLPEKKVIDHILAFFQKNGLSKVRVFGPVSFQDKNKVNFLVKDTNPDKSLLLKIGELEDQVSKLLGCEVVIVVEGWLRHQYKNIIESALDFSEKNREELEIFFNNMCIQTSEYKDDYCKKRTAEMEASERFFNENAEEKNPSMKCFFSLKKPKLSQNSSNEEVVTEAIANHLTASDKGIILK